MCLERGRPCPAKWALWGAALGPRSSCPSGHCHCPPCPGQSLPHSPGGALQKEGPGWGQPQTGPETTGGPGGRVVLAQARGQRWKEAPCGADLFSPPPTSPSPPPWQLRARCPFVLGAEPAQALGPWCWLEDVDGVMRSWVAAVPRERWGVSGSRWLMPAVPALPDSAPSNECRGF